MDEGWPPSPDANAPQEKSSQDPYDDWVTTLNPLATSTLAYQATSSSINHDSKPSQKTMEEHHAEGISISSQVDVDHAEQTLLPAPILDPSVVDTPDKAHTEPSRQLENQSREENHGAEGGVDPLVEQSAQSVSEASAEVPQSDPAHVVDRRAPSGQGDLQDSRQSARLSPPLIHGEPVEMSTSTISSVGLPSIPDAQYQSSNDQAPAQSSAESEEAFHTREAEISTMHAPQESDWEQEHSAESEDPRTNYFHFRHGDDFVEPENPVAVNHYTPPNDPEAPGNDIFFAIKQDESPGSEPLHSAQPEDNSLPAEVNTGFTEQPRVDYEITLSDSQDGEALANQTETLADITQEPSHSPMPFLTAAVQKSSNDSVANGEEPFSIQPNGMNDWNDHETADDSMGAQDMGIYSRDTAGFQSSADQLVDTTFNIVSNGQEFDWERGFSAPDMNFAPDMNNSMFRGETPEFLDGISTLETSHTGPYTGADNFHMGESIPKAAETLVEEDGTRKEELTAAFERAPVENAGSRLDDLFDHETFDDFILPTTARDTDFLSRGSTAVSDLAPEPSPGLSGSNETAHQQSGTTEPVELGDKWAEAFGSPEKGLDDAWGAVFADDNDDDGFLLESTTVSATPVSTAAPAPTTFEHAHAANAYQSGYGVPNALPYAPASSVAPPLLQSRPSSGPMEFFADLPTTQPVRSRKPKPQVYGLGQQPGPAPPMGRPVPPRTSSTSSVAGLQSQLRGPERLELFPPQPDAPPTMAVPPMSMPQGYNPQDYNLQAIPTPPSNQYSSQPHPHSEFLTSAPTLSRPSTTSRYSSAPSQPSVPINTPVPAATAGQSPYAPAIASAPVMSRSSSYVPQFPSTALVAPLTQNAPTSDLRPVAAPQRTNSRYSPAPAAPQPSVTTSHARPTQFAPKDIAATMPPLPAANRFVPRTSSPLAQPHQRPQYDRMATMPPIKQDPPSEPAHPRHRSIGDISETQASIYGTPQAPSESIPQPPRLAYAPPRKVDAQRAPPTANIQSLPRSSKHPSTPLERSTSYAKGYSSAANPAPIPVRPRTSSPTTLRANTGMSQMLVDRAVSAQLPYDTTSGMKQLPSISDDASEFLLPADQTASDPLQRWRGYPIFTWGSAGNVVTSIPKHIPRYGGGQAAPKLKCVPGEVKFHKSKDLFTGQESLLSFPGPLKAKNKKKDVLAWLSTRIIDLEREVNTVPGELSITSSDHTRLNDQLLLWQIMRIMVDNDGLLSGSPAVALAVRQVMYPDVLKSTEPLSAHSPVATSAVTADYLGINQDSNAIVEIRHHLLAGDRDKAIWYAVDKKMWAHAMLIASTGDNKVWKQVIQEFVVKEIRGTQTENHSLAALYEVFGGNWDDSIDQLVPLSARTGFQMVSTAAQTGQNVNAMHGLDKWRETVVLILGNRSPGDEQALLAMGKLLASYGRVEAAHLCYIFARSVAHFGGVDDANAQFTILGADVSANGSIASHDLNSIMLSEVYEFALSLANSSAAYYIPHLQAYKLHHAYCLAEAGMRNEAVQYCDAIASALKSTTRLSPYYHSTLTSQLDDLTKRLSQSPKETTGLFSKPTIGKVSGWFDRFIAGDEGDRASPGSGNASDTEPGPFARLSGGTPTISRTPSSADLQSYELYQPASAGSRFVPPTYNSTAMGDVNRSVSSQYVPTLHGSSPEQLYRQPDQYSSLEASQPVYGMPSAPSSRQNSYTSRYQTNDSPIKLTPSPPYESQNSAYQQSNYPGNLGSSPPRIENQPGLSRTNTLAPSPLGIVKSASSDHDDFHGTIDVPSAGYPMGANNFSSAFDDARQRSYTPSSTGYQPQTPEPPTPGSEASPKNRRQDQSRYSARDYGHPAIREDDEGEEHASRSTSSQPRNSYGPPDEDSVRPSTEFGYESRVEEPQSDSNGLLSQTNEPTSNGYNPVSADGAREFSYGGYQPSSVDFQASGDMYQPSSPTQEPSNTDYDLNSNNYGLPSAGYAPPSTYAPYQPDNSATAEDDESESKPKPKKKSYFDDDDDESFSTRAVSSKGEASSSRAQRDREVDDAVKKAAEADAARDAANAAKKGWLSGWFGGKPKDPGSASGPAAPTVYKAKLGEESSFFFDPETKRWVNRKAPADASTTGTSTTTPAGTPPPPSGPPKGGLAAIGRPPSLGAGGPPLGLASRGASPALPPMPPTGSTPASGSAVAPGTGIAGTPPPSVPALVPLPGSAPPSRPGTSAGAGGGDAYDLLAAGAGPRTGGGAKKGKRGGRYVDVMAK